jgi:hypothetical protein
MRIPLMPLGDGVPYCFCSVAMCNMPSLRLAALPALL